MELANKIKSEKDLAAKFIDHFEGFDIYPEVCVPNSGRICDIVLKAGKMIFAIEVKMAFNITVIYQALNNKSFAHLSYVAVPRPSKASGYRNIEAELLCKHLGIGILYYDHGGSFSVNCMYNTKSRFQDSNWHTHVNEQVAPVYQRPAKVVKLHQWQKRSVAGSQSERLTDWKITIEEITQLINQKGGRVIASEFFKKNYYHYSSSQAARSSLAVYCRKGIIKAFRFEQGYITTKPIIVQPEQAKLL